MRLPKSLAFIVLFAALLAVLAPAMAQEATPEATPETPDSGLLILTGVITVGEDGSLVMVVDGEEYIIAPAGAFQPSNLVEGEIVTLVGRLLPDGLTVQALTLETEDDEEDPDGGVIDPGEEEELAARMGYYCDPESERQHPAAAALAAEFEAEYEAVMGAFCNDGMGFGEIMRGMIIARSAEADMEAVLDARAAGENWKVILAEYDLVPSDLAPGRAKGQQPWDEEETARPNGRPEDAGRPDDTGRPDNAGRPEDAGRPDDTGRPDHAGRPEDAGRPDNPGGGNGNGNGNGKK